MRRISTINVAQPCRQNRFEALRRNCIQQVTQRPVLDRLPGEPQDMPKVNRLVVQPLCDRPIAVGTAENSTNDRRQDGG